MLSLTPTTTGARAWRQAEFGMDGRADRVDGHAVRNGERTGNVDIVNLAMNLISQGFDPELDITHRRPAPNYRLRQRLPIHPRHPYVGDLVYTSFSGSHQERAIKKALRPRDDDYEVWGVPYCPSTPSMWAVRRGRLRVNSQSGKGRRRLHHEGRARLRTCPAAAK